MNQNLTATDSAPRNTQYLRVLALGFSAFIFNTTEFVPVGLLSDIANDFSITAAKAGWMLTVYAWIVALMSLPLMLLTGKMDRKRLLLGTFTLFILSHILSVFAWSFPVLVLSRIGIAFAHAIFWSITASIAMRVAPAGKKAQALSVLATGTALAMVLGLPLGRMIGQVLGWRVTFAVIAVAAVMIMLVLYRMLPALPSLFTGTLSKVPELLKKPTLRGLYLFIFIIYTAQYTPYSYIEPFLIQMDHASNSFTTLILLIFGGAGIFGSVIFGYFGEKYNSPLLIANTIFTLLCMSALLISLRSNTALILLAVIWGAAIMLVNLTVQVKVLNIDSTASDIIMSIYSGTINLGIGTGALLGNQVINHINLSAIGYVGGVFGLLSLLIIVRLLHRYPSLH